MYQQISEEWLKPEGPLIFVAMDDFQDHTTGGDRLARRSEFQFHIPAVAAFKRLRDLAGERQAATPAKRRPDEPDLLPASRTHKPFARGSAFFTANLADIRIHETQRHF